MRSNCDHGLDAAILCGGLSRRMGHNKAFLLVGGRPLIESQIAILQRIFGRVMLVGRCLEEYRHLPVTLVPDAPLGRGALVGIYSGLLAARERGAFFVSCDIPFLNEALVRYMVQASEGQDIVVPQSRGGLEPTHAIYAKRCLPYIKAQLEQGDLKIIRFFPRMRVRIVKEEEIRRFDPSGKALVNINTPEDYERYCGEGRDAP